MVKRKRLSLAYFIAIVLLIGVALVAVQSGMLGVKLSWVSPGWEIYDQMGAMKFNNQILTKEDQFNTPRDLTGPYWKVDVDNETYSIPTIMVQLSDVKHCDLLGRDLPYDQYIETRTVTRGNVTYYLDYHIYMYTVTIRTIADKTVILGGFFTTPLLYHETSWPYVWQTILQHGSSPPYYGRMYEGGAYPKFVINPWKGASYRTTLDGKTDKLNASYTLVDAWAGVMNCYVNRKTQDTVDNQWGNKPTPNPDAQPFVKGGIDEGNQVPMFEDDGTFGDPAPVVDWGPTVTPDDRIESAVVNYLPVQLSAGAQTHYNSGGTADEIYPVDVAVMYQIRVDVLQTHEFALQTGHAPDPKWPTDYFGWSESFWTSLLNGLNPFGFLGAFSPLAWFIVTLIVIAFIILIVLAVFAPWVLPKIFGGLRQARDFTFEGTGRKKKG